MRLESQWPSDASAAELWSRMLREREIRRIGRLGGDRRPHTEGHRHFPLRDRGCKGCGTSELTVG
jgi:hypothetical protein